ncbi:MAG: redoxin domain-containing protein [Halioglobus sp.]
MRAVKRLCFILFLYSVGLAAHADELKVGDIAPTFKLEASDGNTYDLAFFQGKRAVVIAWFPKAYTSGCTVECKSLANKGHLIRKYDVAYFMASVDELADNKGFAEETGADFPLLSDPSKAVAKAYGVLQPKGYAARQTFYIGIDGRILKIDDAINPETSAEDMAKNLKRLGVSRIDAAE